MEFYPLFEEIRRGSEPRAIQTELLKKFSDRYKSHSDTRRVKNAGNVSMEQFRKDVEDVAADLEIDLVTTEIIPPGRSNPKAESDTYQTLYIKLKDHDRKDFGMILANLSGRLKTSTDFKEGMVCFFFNSEKEYEPFNKRGKNTEEVYIPLIEEMIVDIEKNGIDGVENKTKGEILDFLKNNLDDYDSGVLDSIFNAMSIGNYLRNHPNIGNWTILRDQLFSDIKKAGKAISGYPEDKWCPMDIMLVKTGNESEIRNKINEAKSEKNEELKLGTLNGMFLDDLDSKNPASIIAGLSLKEQKARAGNAKSYVDSLDVPTDLKYNLSPEEKDWFGDNEKIKDEITKMRRKIRKIIKTELPDMFEHKAKDQNIDKFGEGIEDRANYLAKYGSLKMLLFFLEEAKDNKNIFIELASYGLSLGVNPTFFKVLGNKEGDPSKVKDHIEIFERDGGVELFHSPGHDYDDKIWIIDNNKASNVKLIYWVVFASWVYVVHIYIRTNQPKSKIAQVIVEIDKFEKYKDLR